MYLSKKHNMLQTQKKILDASRAAIVKDLQVKDVFNELRSDLILTHEDTERILNEKTSREQAQKLLDILSDKGSNAFESFQKCLREKYPHLAELLMEGCNRQETGELNQSKQTECRNLLLLDGLT